MPYIFKATAWKGYPSCLHAHGYAFNLLKLVLAWSIESTELGLRYEKCGNYVEPISEHAAVQFQWSRYKAEILSVKFS